MSHRNIAPRLKDLQEELWNDPPSTHPKLLSPMYGTSRQAAYLGLDHHTATHLAVIFAPTSDQTHDLEILVCDDVKRMEL